MIIKPYSFNGVSLQSTDFDASYPQSNSSLSPSVNQQYVNRAGAWPVLSGSNFNPTSIGIEVLCAEPFMTTFETLTKVFNVEDETPRQFIVQDTADLTAENPKRWYVYAVPRAASGGSDGNLARVPLALDNPIWTSVTQNSQTFATTSATDSTSVTNNGNADAYPIFEITPTGLPSSDFAYNRFVQILPTSARPWPNRLLDVCGTTDGTGLDTAALVAGGKMQIDGDDFRVVRDGLEIDRQLSNINTTDTHALTVADFPAAANMTLKTAIATTDTVTEVELNYTTANKAIIQKAKPKGRLILDTTMGSTDTEEMVYTAKTVTATKLAFTVRTRAERGTVAVDHAANTAVRILPYAYNLVYGNPDVSAPTIDETKKPIQDLTSRNTAFVYTNFRDLAGLRSGIFNVIPASVSNPRLTKSGTYTSTNDLGDTDPAAAMGVKAMPYEKDGTSRPDSVSIGWIGYFPDFIASISSVTGEQSQSSTIWPTLALQTSNLPDSTSFTNLWTVSAQVTTDYSTFTTWTKASSDATVPANQGYLRFLQEGNISGVATRYAKGAISAITVGLTNVPHIMIRAEMSNYRLNCRIRNETTGDYFDLLLPMELNETVYVDTNPDFPTVTYKGEIINGVIKTSTTRSEWLKLSPGANSIGYETLGLTPSDVSINIKWNDRKRFL